MAYKGSLFQVLDESGKIKGELVFDSIVSEAHEVSNKVTEFPVDTGFVVSDHVIRKNRVLTMDIVSVRHAMEGRQRGGLTAGKHNKIKEHTWNLSMTLVWLPHSDDMMVDMTMERARRSSSTSSGSNKPCWEKAAKENETIK